MTLKAIIYAYNQVTNLIFHRLVNEIKRARIVVSTNKKFIHKRLGALITIPTKKKLMYETLWTNQNRQMPIDVLEEVIALKKKVGETMKISMKKVEKETTTSSYHITEANKGLAQKENIRLYLEK